MKILHTSDWHIGRALYGRRRYEEFARFFDWLIACIKSEGIDVLLVAGDIFDTTTPSNTAQELYYRFLCRVADAGCHHVVITAGNHDSPSLLNAPREILRHLNVHVIGSISESVADELVVLRDGNNEPQLIVCAVPYLRDRDIRRAEAGESFADKDRKLVEGIRDHYQAVAEAAMALASAKEGDGKNVPIVAMGHLFVSGSKTDGSDGVRDLYVGNLGQVRGDSFPDCFAYLALGHLHVGQKVTGSDIRRYSGSPLPMSFGEADHAKVVLAVTVTPEEVTVCTIAVPSFQRLASVRGDWPRICEHIETLRAETAPVWIEVLYQGEEILGDLQERVRELTVGTTLEVLRTKDLRLAASSLSRLATEETLDDLKVEDVFGRCLTDQNVPPEQRAELIALFQETILALHHEDGGDVGESL